MNLFKEEASIEWVDTQQCVPTPFQKGEVHILKISGGTWKINLGWGHQKRGIFSERKGGIELFKQNLGIEKNKNEDF